MAKIYDVALVVRFVSFSKEVNWVSGTPYVETGLSSESMNVPSFEQEQTQVGAAQHQDLAQGNTIGSAAAVNTGVGVTAQVGQLSASAGHVLAAIDENIQTQFQSGHLSQLGNVQLYRATA